MALAKQKQALKGYGDGIVKLCSRCKLWKTRDAYTRHKGKLDGLYPYCKDCRVKIRAESYERTKRKDASRSRKRRYGVAGAQFYYLKGKQEDKCAICREPFDDAKQTHLDHCHKTGRIRGVLCKPCNNGLGFFKDNTENLNRAIVYLNTSRDVPKENRLFDPEGAA